MLARLGDVLYWFWTAVSILVAIGGIAIADKKLGPEFLIAVGVLAALAWLVGRASRYVLSGK
jgi:hypothetical protein